MDIEHSKNVFNQSTPITPANSSSSSQPVNQGSSSQTSSSSSNNSVRNNSNTNASHNNQVFSDPNTDFSNFLKTALGGDGKSQVSEEELYAGLIFQRLHSKSQEISSAFNDEKAKIIDSLKRPDGVYSHEDLAAKALENIVGQGIITKEEAEKINGEAFLAAQLDSNLETLYDDRGSASDQTIAVAEINEALTKAQAVIDGINDGSKTVESRALSGSINSSAGSSGSISIISDNSSGQISEQSLDGAGGFVWKPISDSDGKLVVLLPAVYAGMIKRVEVHSSLPPTEETKVEEGNYKYDSNGGRPTYRFTKPGSQYGDNLHVVAYKDDGSMLSWSIKDGGQRYD